MEKHCIHSLFYDLEQTSRVCRAFCESYFEENVNCNITLDEFIILETIICNPDVCQRDLAKLILKGTSHTSKLLVTLENKKFIGRTVDIKNNRIVKRIEVTDEGYGVYKTAKAAALEYAARIENIIGEKEAQECSKFLHKIKDTVTASSKIVFE